MLVLGKSTLVQHIIKAFVDEYKINPISDVAYAAYTGAAARVLIQKGNLGATTTHKLLYNTTLLESGKYCRKKKEITEKIVIIDECSMLPNEMKEELLSRPNIFVIFCGDPGQLPPVTREEDNHLLDNPHVFLNEIMRQALDSDIIKLSMNIREGKKLTPYDGTDVKILRKSELNEGMLLWADTILCATNKVRNELNKKVRELKGFGPEPQEGDKVICLHNYDVTSFNGAPLVNGITGTISNCYRTCFYPPKYLYEDKIELLGANFISSDGEDYGKLNLDYNEFKKGEPFTNNGITIYRFTKNKKYKDKLPYDFTYGYAETYWKAQGQEWDKVLIIEEDFPFDKEEHRKALYTAVTRGAKKVVLILKD